MSEIKKSHHQDSNNTSSSSSSGRVTDRMVSLVTLNSSDESSRSNSSLASSSHSNIDLIIDASMVGGLATSTSTPSPILAAANTPTKSVKKAMEDNDDDEEEEEETTESWSVKTSAIPGIGGGHFRRRNSSTSIYGTPRRQTSFFGGATTGTTTTTTTNNAPTLLSSVYDELMIGSSSSNLGVVVDSPDQEQRNNNDDDEYNCVECGSYCDRYSSSRNKFASDINGSSTGLICETCMHKHWQDEVNELLKFKASLETNVRELRRYLNAKKNQCNENIKSSQQIKKFINMTMQQIKRKVELDLENKRDELFNSIDTFVETQKKLSTSINEDNFQTSERIINEIENILLNTDTDLNFFKLKSVKTFAKSQINKLNQQKSSRIPLYSIFFVPDSTVQVNNTFGKIVLKSHLTDSTIDGVESTLSEFQQQLENNFRNDLTITGGSSLNFDSSNKNSNDLLLTPAESLSLGLFDNTHSSYHHHARQLAATNSIKSKLLQQTAETNSSSRAPIMKYTTSTSSYPSRDLYAAASKWTSYDNVYDSLSNMNGAMSSSSLSQSQNPIESGFATVRKYQPQYRNNDVSMRRAKAYMPNSPTKGPNIQRLTKALSVHSPSESDEISENYEEIFARKESNPLQQKSKSPPPSSTPTPTSTAENIRPKSSSVYENRPRLIETVTKPSNIENSKSTTSTTKIPTPTTTPLSPSRQTASSSLLKDLDVPKSKPFVPAKVLMSQNSTGSSNSSTNMNSSSVGRKNTTTSGSSVVQKLIQTHNQAVAAAAAAAAATARPFSPPPSNAAFKQPTVVANNQSTPK